MTPSSLIEHDAERVDVLGIPMYAAPLRHAVDTIIATCTTPTAPRASRLISATGAHGLVHARRNPAFAELLGRFTINLPDGLPGVWVGKHLKHAANMEQIRGADFFAGLITASADTPIRHFFCGGKRGIADQLRDVCRARMGNDRVVGTYCPPFRAMTEAEWAELAGLIEELRVDVVWIGLSTPKQEAFARELAARIRVHYIATIGAAFDFHTGTVREAPRVMRRVGLEWFYRMCTDPKRLVRRYAEVVPLFIYFNAKDVLKTRLANNTTGRSCP